MLPPSSTAISVRRCVLCGVMLAARGRRLGVGPKRKDFWRKAVVFSQKWVEICQVWVATSEKTVEICQVWVATSEKTVEIWQVFVAASEKTVEIREVPNLSA